MTGINITPFLAASAALLVGLGLALQDLFQDIIGGIFIILDKSLLVGDVIEVEGKVGKVLEIKLRTTRALTRDDKIIIIPNHVLIRNSIYNFTQNRKTTREEITVGVAYGSNTELVKNLLLKSVNNHKGVLLNPKPFVIFDDFGDSALIFKLKFFVKDSFRVPALASDIRFQIDELFRENNVSIPFPQRDVHFYPTTSKDS
jgi:small-conductance mechanosensitive channel